MNIEQIKQKVTQSYKIKCLMSIHNIASHNIGFCIADNGEIIYREGNDKTLVVLTDTQGTVISYRENFPDTSNQEW